MRVLLTGGLGYIGSHTAVCLLKNDIDVVIADNLSNSKINVIDKIKKITNKDFDFHKIDVEDYESLKNVFIKTKIDAVVHFAGYKAVGESCQKPLMYYENNLKTTLTLLKVMKEFECKNLVFSSSATVYKDTNLMPVDENGELGATNPYGRTKLFIEEILKDVSKADAFYNIALLRYFNPIGADESGLIGEDPNGIPNNLMPYISKVATGKLEKLSIFGNDYNTHDGTGVRDYIHVSDLANGHYHTLVYMTKNHIGCDAFNLGTGIGYSVLDIVNTYNKVCGNKVKYVFTSRRSGDVAEVYSNPKKANEILNWKAEKTLEDMCLSSYNFEKANS